MRSIPAFLFALLVSTTFAFAQKPVERSPLEIGHDYYEALANEGSRFVSTVDGTPRQMAFLNYEVAPGEPEAMARQYLQEQSAMLRSTNATLQHLRTRSGLSGHTVRFVQVVDGVPVYDSETLVNIDHQNRVQLVVNGTRAHVDVATTPAVSESTARQIAFDHLGIRGELLVDETELMIYPTESGTRLVWRVQLTTGYAEPRGDWESVVDAHTGELVRVADRSVYAGNEEDNDDKEPSYAPTAASHMAMMRVDGTAMVFNPDPLTTAGANYGGGYVETTGSVTPCRTDPSENPACDIDTSELTAERVMVTLPDILFDGANYHLEGDYAEIREIESPNRGLFEQATSDWDDTRNPAAFEGANVYYHIDTYMRYINEDLGIPVMPNEYVGGVRFDAHGLGGADNSYYSPSGGFVVFGEGGVDDSEDADVIIHELGHGLDDWLSGSTNQPDGLSEGFGDYVAVSYTRSLGLLQPSDPEYYWVFKWDGHNPFWPGRICNWTANYPTGGVPHQRGQHWCTANMKIWDDLGQEETDTAVFEGFTMTSGSTSQPQAAQAVLQAAANMGYSQADLNIMHTHYTDQGYTVTLPVANEGTPSTEVPRQFDLTAAYPNPFNPSANFTLRVESAQQVDIALFDALGRHVQTIYSGQMAAGERRVFTINGSALPSGLYVYRAVGEGFSDSRSLVLQK